MYLNFSPFHIDEGVLLKGLKIAIRIVNLAPHAIPVAHNPTVDATTMVPKATVNNEVTLSDRLVHIDLQPVQRVDSLDTVWTIRLSIDELLVVSETEANFTDNPVRFILIRERAGDSRVNIGGVEMSRVEVSLKQNLIETRSLVAIQLECVVPVLLKSGNV